MPEYFVAQIHNDHSEEPLDPRDRVWGNFSRTDVIKVAFGATMGLVTGHFASQSGKTVASTAGSCALASLLAMRVGLLSVDWDRVFRRVDATVVLVREMPEVAAASSESRRRLHTRVRRRYKTSSEEELNKAYQIGEMPLVLLSFLAGIALGISYS